MRNLYALSDTFFEFDYFYTMDFRDIISIFEVLLLAAVFIFLFRFIFTNELICEIREF